MPSYFRGDGAEKCSIIEWEELLRAYFAKRELPSSEMIEEIVNRLMDRARENTKVCHFET